MKDLQEKYFAVWATVFPILSFLVVPSIQGTTPTYLLALLSLGFVPFFRPDKSRDYLKILGVLAGVWLFLLLGSQLGLYLSGAQALPKVLVVDFNDNSVLFRQSLFTQSIYLLACVLTALYFVYGFQSEWTKYIFWGAWVLAIYGIYEWLYFLIFHKSGDFLANRSFLGGEHPGSWSQTFQLGKLELLRIKSTTGEPSMYALTALPYLIFAAHAKRWYLTGALLFGLVLSFSTSGYLSLLILGAYTLVYFKAWHGKYLIAIAGVLVALAILYLSFPDFMRVVFEQKLSGEGGSGGLRKHIYETAWYFWLSSGLINKVVGIGFGNAFVTPLLGGILVNTGIIGVILYLAAFLIPLIKLPNTADVWPLKAGLVVLLFMLSVSLAEFAYPTTWMVLGLAYRKLRRISSGSTSMPVKLKRPVVSKSFYKEGGVNR